jgi:superfamily I DNA/RNA helicase
MRIINPEIAKLSFRFAKEFVDNSVQPINVPNELVFEKYWIKYWNIGRDKDAESLCKNIKWILQKHNINPRKTVVLSESINILRDIEKFYTDANHSCMTNFETAEQYEELRRAQQRPSLVQKDLKERRRAAKTHFTTDCDELKLSTIHSFKGWESETIILFLQPEMEDNCEYEGYFIQERENTPALIYTALTRAKCNLFIINLGNNKYHHFFESNI